MGIEQLDEKQTFEKLIEAIKEENVEQLRRLLSHARQSKYNIFEQVDVDGNTIMHHAIMQANREVMGSIMTYETGREASFGVQNNQGKTPYQCMLDLPETKQAFKDLVKSKLGPSWQQSYILNQFKQYLHYQRNKDGCDLHLMSELPEDSAQYKNSYIFIKKSDTQDLYHVNPDGKYEKIKIIDFNLFEETINAIKNKDETKLHLSEEQIKRIVTSNGGHIPDPTVTVIERLKSGHCNGLASIWLQCWLNGKEEQYYEIFKDIIAWDKAESSLSEDLVKKFEFAIQLTRSYHMDSSMSSFLNLSESINSDVVVRRNMWEKVWGEESYQMESRSDSEISLEGLSYFLQQLARPENEGKGFGLNTKLEAFKIGHAISAAYRDGKLHIYDSNRPSANQDETKPDIIKIFDLSQKEGIDAAAREIRVCLYDNLGSTPDNFFVEFSAYDHKGKPPGVYITLEQAEARRFYQAVKENKPVNPIEFAKKISDIHAYSTPEELNFMYKNIVFDKSKINDIFSAGWDDYSPLLKVIRCGHYPQAVQALIQYGANPNLEVEGVSPISEAKSKGMKDIADILEAKPDKPSLPNKAKIRINVMKIPANEREANILAVYNVLNNDDLLKNKDGEVPNIIKEMRDIVGKLDPKNEEEIAGAILEIKSRIAHGSEDNINDNVRDVLNGFAKSSCCDFQKIRAALSDNPAMDEIMNKVNNLPNLMQA
ncbi:TPA: hypothetical protein ACT9K3_001866 [Legionella pneumophila]